MTEYIKKYIKELDESIKENKCKKEMIDIHLNKIEFFQKERLIHLIVMFASLLFMLAFVALSYLDIGFILISLILLIISIFYIKHYYFLENNVQYMYKQYDELLKKCK